MTFQGRYEMSVIDWPNTHKAVVISFRNQHEILIIGFYHADGFDVGLDDLFSFEQEILPLSKNFTGLILSNFINIKFGIVGAWIRKMVPR